MELIHEPDEAGKMKIVFENLKVKEVVKDPDTGEEKEVEKEVDPPQPDLTRPKIKEREKTPSEIEREIEE